MTHPILKRRGRGVNINSYHYRVINNDGTSNLFKTAKLLEIGYGISYRVIQRFLLRDEYKSYKAPEISAIEKVMILL